MEQEVLHIDYQELCQRMDRGLKAAEKALVQVQQVIKETQEDCQRMCDCAALEQMEALREGCGSEEEYRQKRQEFLQRAAREMGKMWN